MSTSCRSSYITASLFVLILIQLRYIGLVLLHKVMHIALVIVLAKKDIEQTMTLWINRSSSCNHCICTICCPHWILIWIHNNNCIWLCHQLKLYFWVYCTKTLLCMYNSQPPSQASAQCSLGSSVYILYWLYQCIFAPLQPHYIPLSSTFSVYLID